MNPNTIWFLKWTFINNKINQKNIFATSVINHLLVKALNEEEKGFKPI